MLDCTAHPECRRMAPHANVYNGGRYPGRTFPDRGAALRIVGQRHVVHPYDVWTFMFDYPEHARIIADADLAHFGHPSWTATVEAAGTLYVLDLRPALAEHGVSRLVDPELPDDVSPKIAWPKPQDRSPRHRGRGR